MARILAPLAGLVPLLAAAGAEAHHAMGGSLPGSFGEGLLSGLGHPVIGLDHLAFVVAAGIVAGVCGRGLWLPVVFAAASLGGVLLHLQELDLPLAEALIALSVAAAGLVLAAARADLGRGIVAAGFALAGLLHGYAYGESIVGAEPTPLAAYLLGLAAVQSAIGIAVARLIAGRAWQPAGLAPRLAGAAVFGIGLSALAGQLPLG